MSSKAKNPYADSEFLRSAFIETVECERAHKVHIVRTITLADKPFALHLHLQAYAAEARAMDKPLCTYRAWWPNAEEQTFAAFLFRATVMLSRLVEDSRAELWRDTLRAQKRG